MKAKRLLLPLVMVIVMMAMCPQRMWAISGSGTSTSHYQIGSTSDWLLLSTKTNYINSSSSSPVYIDLTGDFSVSSVKSPDKDVYIVLDGQGHTIKLDAISTSAENTGLFGKIGGGEVKNLRIAGNISSSEKYMGNLCGRITGDLTITNVLCSASIASYYEGDATTGGLVGQIDDGTVTFNQCGFTYKFYGKDKAYNMCGMVGYRNRKGTVVFNNCFCKAVWETVLNGDNYAYMRNDGSNTTYTNCYYVNVGPRSETKATDKSSGGPTQIAESKFSTGELAYKLNGSSNGVARWYQNLDNGSTDNYPFPYTTSASSHGKVYYGSFHGTTKYSNYSHTLTTHIAVAQTCSTDGNILYYTCNCGNGKNYTNTAGTTTTSSVTLAKYNHIGHGKGYTATYDWSGSSYSSAQCKATLKCGNCSTTLESNKTLTVALASQTEATCTADATRTYKATGTNSSYSFSYANTSPAYAASGTLGHVFGSNDPNKTFCTQCNHTFLYYTANAKVTPTTRYASLPGYSGSNNNYDSTTKKGVIELTSKLTSIGEGQFSYMPDLTGITIPVSVTTIGKSAFRQSGLTGTLNIPSSVTSIEDFAFNDCGGLTGTLNIPSSVTSIGSSAFAKCSGLTGTLNIPSSITTIGESTFEDCSGLTGTLDIPSSVTSIGSRAFSGCLGLSSIIIPSSVTSIGSYAFSNSPGSTPSLTSVTVKTSSVLTFNLFFRETLLGMSVTLYVPSSLAAQYKTASGWKAFGKIRCITHDITHVETVPATCTTNGIVEHWYCRACESYYKNAACIEEYSSAEVVEAAYGVHKFDLATDPHSTVCTSCKHTFLRYRARDDIGENKTYLFPGYSRINIFDDNKKQGVIEFTTTLTTIPDSTFIKAPHLYSINIPSSVTSIGNFAFMSNTRLDSITIPSSVTSIGESAFVKCIGLTDLKLGTGLTSIGALAFSYCKSLTEVTIPSSVTYIGQGAFSFCSSLTKVTVKTTTVPYLYDNTFDDPSAMTLYVPSSLAAQYKTAAGWKAFGKIRCITHVLDANGACSFCEFIRGDINCDHYLTVADLAELVRLLGQEGTINCPEADVDGNGTVNIDDVNALSNKILGK